MATRNPPSWLQAGSHPAEQDRLLIGALVPQEGAVSSADLLVHQAATPAMSVLVDAGSAFIKNDLATWGGTYHVVNDAAVTLSIGAANATNPRNDLVVARVRDSQYSGGTNAWDLAVIAGTPAASPVDPSIPADGSYLLLARVRVNAAATSITDAVITDLRTRAAVPANVASPIGSVVSYAGSAAPAGWLLCDGSEASRTVYAALFAVVGTTYGPGNGSTTFNVPDLRGRSPMGAGTGTGLTARTLGAKLGEEGHVLTLAETPGHSHVVNAHNHGAVNLAHSHYVNPNGTHSHGVDGDAPTGLRIVITHNAGVDRMAANAGDGGTQTPTTISRLDNNGNHDHGTDSRLGDHTHANETPGTNAQGGGGAHNVVHPVLVLNAIIRAL